MVDSKFPVFSDTDVVLGLEGWGQLPDYKTALNGTFASREQARRIVQQGTRYSTAMSPAPTESVSAPNAASTISGAVAVNPTDPAVRLACGIWTSQGWGYYATANNDGASWDWQGYGEIEFCWEGRLIDFRVAVTSPSGRMRIRVNGEYVSLSAVPLTANDGNTYLIHEDFGSVAPRHIVVEMCSAGFVGLYVEPTAIVWAAPPRSTRALFLGDSYTALANAAETVVNGYAMEVCRRLGWDEPWLCGESGTGYLATASGSGAPGRAKYRDRLAADVYPNRPDVIVVLGSINDADGTHTQGEIQTEVEAFLADILTNAPVGLAGYKPRLFIVGCQQPSGSPLAVLTSTNTAIKTACTNHGVTFIDPTGWITGTGHVGATTGSGNADWAISSDGVHPTDAGHLYLGRRIAAAIAAVDLGRVA